SPGNSEIRLREYSIGQISPPPRPAVTSGRRKNAIAVGLVFRTVIATVSRSPWPPPVAETRTEVFVGSCRRPRRSAYRLTGVWNHEWWLSRTSGCVEYQ